jgi:hypothetical protein
MGLLDEMTARSLDQRGMAWVSSDRRRAEMPVEAFHGNGMASKLEILRGVMKFIQRWPFRSFAERKWFTTADAIDLPDYGCSSSASLR